MSTLLRVRYWLKAYPLALDAALAAAVLICMVGGSFVDPNAEDGAKWGARTPDALRLALMTPAAATLVFRRRAPMAVLAVTAALSLASPSSSS